VGLVVTGISPHTDVSDLQRKLKEAGFAPDPIQVVSAGDSEETIPERSSTMPLDTHLSLGDDQGTGVPGLNRTTVDTHSLPEYFRNEELWDRLGDFEIPDDEVDNYIEAVQAGRAIVAYFAHKQENVPKLEELFRASGLSKVKTF
jgi:hypothetical protein